MAVNGAFLKDTYENFYKGKYYFQNENECNKVLSQWKEWRNKILQETLSLDEYVNRRGQVDDYLIYYLNNTSSCFGRSREGNAHQWMIKLNTDNNTYYTAEYTDDSMRQIPEDLAASKFEAEELYKQRILPLLKNVIEKCTSVQTLTEFVSGDDAYKWFRCEQMLEKIMVLESLSDNSSADLGFCLPNFYKGDVINKLYGEWFELAGETTRIGMGYSIMKACYDALGITDAERDAEKQFEVSLMLWELATCDSLELSETSPNIIFYGSPGTGKTYAVKKAIRFLTGGNDDRVVFIQCHPGFDYEDFIEGIKPVGFTYSGGVKLEVVNGVFKDLCIKAKNDPNNEYYFVADEINRANLSSMFGEVLSLMEADYRDDGKNNENLIKTPLSKLIEYTIKERDDLKDIIAYKINENGEVYFGVPQNIRFIGMMNDVDKSIDSFDLALRRRFKWIRKDCDYDVIYDQLSAKYDPDSVELYVNRCESLNYFISRKDGKGLGFGSSYEFGHAYFLKITGARITKASYEVLFEEHLRPVLTEYIRSFMDDSEIDGALNKAKSHFCI